MSLRVCTGERAIINNYWLVLKKILRRIIYLLSNILLQKNPFIHLLADPRALLITLALRTDISSLCVLYCIYHGECSKELIDLLLAAEFSNRTVRHKLKYLPHHLHTWHSTTVRFRKKFLPRAK